MKITPRLQQAVIGVGVLALTGMMFWMNDAVATPSPSMVDTGSFVGACSTVGSYSSTVGGYSSTVGGLSSVGGYSSPGCVQYGGRAYGMDLTASAGKITQQIGPQPDTGWVSSEQPTNTDPACAAGTSASSGLLRFEGLCARVQTSDSASTALSSVGTTVVKLPGEPAVEIGQLTSQSTTSCQGSSADTTLSSLSIGTKTVIDKTHVFTKEVAYSVAKGVTVSIDPTTAVGGLTHGLSVDAIVIAVNLGSVKGTVILASSTSTVKGC